MGVGGCYFCNSPTRKEMEKACSVRLLGSCNFINDETSLLNFRRCMIILKYDPLLSKCSIVIVFKCMTFGEDDTALFLTTISYNMADEPTNPVCNLLVCLKFMD